MGYQLDETGPQVQNRLFKADASLNLSQAESFVGDGTYKSPSTYVQTVPGTVLTLTAGINGTPDTDWEIINKLTNANDVKELTHQSKFDISNGDTIDFFIKGTANFTMEKAIFNILKLG